mmetsp:Transcript_63060/g.148088  ORF Transcript_63060/g.148088 Transcript_63060/m.148088 type:complete len:620 (+) Transcript_63060:68-1927(+)
MFSCDGNLGNPCASALEAHARKLQSGGEQIESAPQLFVMYVVPAEVLLRMTELKPHEELRCEGILVEFDRLDDADAMFVSHQWAGRDHPDPNLDQFKVLQDSLRNMMSGKGMISGNISFELYAGRETQIFARNLVAKPLFIWYDYFCCPQSASAAASRQLAIESIPAYVDKCQYFAVLCPHVRHAKHEHLLNKRSWENRGWCRLERVARELSTRADTSFSIEIQGATHQAQAAIFGIWQAPVGEGSFTVAADRGKIALVLQTMVRRKLHSYLARGDLHNYRLMLNLQRVVYRNLPTDAVEDVVPGYVSSTTDPATETVDSFMYQNGFTSLARTPAGWTPVCYAALDGSPLLLAGLLERKADANDKLKEPTPGQFGKETPLLHMCAFLRNNEGLRILLKHNADVTSKDGFGATALHWAAFSNNVDGLQELLAADADPREPNMLNYSPFCVASAAGCLDAMRALLRYATRDEVDFALHAAMLQGGGSAEMVTALINAGADINCQLRVPTFSPLGILFGMMSLRHRWKESMLSTYAYHHHHATPLMCSVITDSFEATGVLLAAGARPEMRNGRGRTAAELAAETKVPSYVQRALEGDASSTRTLHRDVSEALRELECICGRF